MIGQQLGPYTIEAELGSGGMGTVYRATGPEGQVALKVVHPHLLATPGFFKRFLREAEIGRLVEHHSVVRTLDCDQLVVDGTPHAYLVMEFVEGKSLRELLQDLGTIPETLLREIALQTAAGLAAIHEAGIIHRDLKPENILITNDHEIRIMDLGVAKLQEATIELTREGQFAGSLLYAAPEQFRSDLEVGAGSDLYSLGVLFYELATGDNPFRRDDPAQVIDAHLHHEPRRIYEYNTETTRFLAELVACLLAKEPSRRFGSAESLHHILLEAERSTWWKTLAPALDRRPGPNIRVRRETKLHGRGGDVELLQTAWELAKAGRGNTVWIDGEAGIGKTRLLADFLGGVQDDAHVLYGSYPPSGGLGGFSDAILDHFGEVGLEERLKPFLTVTPLLVPAFAALVTHDAPPEGAEPIQGASLNAVGVHLMRGLAAEKPTIWIVDDLHFAPKESRDLALSLSRAVEGHRALLVFTARPGVPDEELAHFERLENFQRTQLARLGGREIIELLEDAFKSELLAEKLGGKITKKSDGVPFFVFEMIRGLKEGQFIKQQADGAYVQTQMITDIEVPSAVKDLIEGRLKGLTRDQRRIMNAGCVQGLTFDPVLVARVLDEKVVRVLEELAEIEREFGLVQGEADTVRFDQNQIQEVVYGELMPHLRSEYHTLSAEAHADRIEGEPSSEDALFLASHHLRGSRPKEGLPHLTPALKHLEQCYRNGAAIDLAARALDAPGLLEGKERVETLLRKAGRHALRGEQEMQRTALDEALALADRSADAALRAKVRVPLGGHLIQTSDYAAAQESLEQALDLAREAEDKKTEARAALNLANVLVNQGRFEEAGAQFESSLALSREIGHRQGEAGATGGLGNVFLSQGRYEEAGAQYEKWLALSREVGDRRGEAVATGNLGLVFLSQGRHEEARAQHEKWLALAREIGDRQSETIATGNLGNVFLTQCRFEEAGAQFDRSFALAREIGDRQGEVGATAGLASVFLSQGRPEEASARFEESLTLAREIGHRQSEGNALVGLGPLQAALGQTDLARETLNESLRVLREIGARWAEGYALDGLGHLAEQRGEAEEARRFYEEALALRREIAYTSGAASTLVALGRLAASQGDEAAATAHLEEAVSLSERTQIPNLILSATVERARLPGGDVEAALAALEEHEERVPHEAKMEARFRLWELTQGKEYLVEAHRLLVHFRDHAPENCRDSLIENVPLHREIMEAWEEHGGEE